MSQTRRDPVPHHYPARFVETEVSCGGERAALVLATAAGATTGVGPWPVTLVAEALAQAILLVVQPRGGARLRLVGIDGMELLQTLNAGDRVEVAVDEEGAFGSLRRYCCRAWSAGALAAVARITVSG